MVHLLGGRMKGACVMSLTVVRSVEPCSPAQRAGVRTGEILTHINGHPIVDVLDYKFYSYDPRLELTLKAPDGAVRTLRVHKAEGEDLGLEFETYLMDRQHTCRIRVQRAGMADFFHMQNAPQLCHHVMGSIALFFIYVNNSIYHQAVPLLP